FSMTTSGDYYMKKSLLALAVLGAFAGVAQAQTNVTLYGSIDAGLRRVDKANAAGDSRWTMGSNGTFQSNRIGFKGVEDLGGGLNAHFTLESGFNSGTGAFDNTTNQLFQRTASVGLGGAWGSVDLGRQYTVAYRTTAVYDPFNYKFTTLIPVSGLALSGSRLNNDVQGTAVFGPVTARAEYALGEVAGSTSAGSTKAIGATFASGPFSAGAAYSKRSAAPIATGASITTALNSTDGKNWTVGGAFATGPFRVAAGYMDEKLEPIGISIKNKSYWAGGSYNFTEAMALTAGYYRFKTTPTGFAEGKRDLFIIGGTYAVSKRTNFYLDVDRNKFTGSGVTASSTAGTGLTPISSSSIAGAGVDKAVGVSVGINHVF
ncbi:MAG TPA: porin, partial [Candidatus Saccharimonadales bacterium]|nr:porin [Candidatus Saccharimonadales bacterium]